MFSKKYFKKLFTNLTLFERILMLFFTILMLFFSIADINHGIILSPNYNGYFTKIIGQTLLVLSSILTSLMIINRLHKFKQELVFLFSSSVATGLGLLLIGWGNFVEGKGSMVMGPALIQIFIFGMSGLSGLSKYSNNKEDVVSIKREFLSRELVIATVSVLMLITPFYILFDKLGSKSGDIAGGTISGIHWISIIGFAFAAGAIIVLALYRWQWIFIFFMIADFLIALYYILLKAMYDGPLLSLASISLLFFTIDIYVLYKWIKK